MADDGTYAIAIPLLLVNDLNAAAEEVCYYVQFEVEGSYTFTNPANSKTSNIYVAVGGWGGHCRR